MRAKTPAVNVLEAIRGQHWAITESALDTMLAIANRDHAALEAKLQAVLAERGEPLHNTRAVEVRDGVAIIPVRGPMARYATFLTEVSGMTSYDVLATDIRTALNDASVRAIVLHLDSPGGAVNGVIELTEQIYGARGVKPIVAVASQLAASAAYVLAAAADEVVATPSAEIGSLGGILTVEVRDARPGIRMHRFVSTQSPRKNVDPETDEGRAALQQHVDAHAQILIETVAKYRGITPDGVLEDYGQGALLVGQAAVDAGMADRMATTEDVIAELSANVGSRSTARIARSSFSNKGATQMQTKANADAPAPTTAAAPAAPAPAAAPTPAPAPAAAPAPAPAAATAVADLATLRAEAAAAERARVLGIQALARSPNDEVVTACVNDPACTVEAAALRITQDTQAKAKARMDARAANETGSPLPSGAAVDTTPAPGANLVAALRLIRPEKTAAAPAVAAQ